MIKLAQVQQEVGEIVAEAPEGFCYKLPDQDSFQRCANVRRDATGKWCGDCLIGIWILRFPGKDMPDLAETLGTGSARAVGVAAALKYLRSYTDLHIEISELAVRWLTIVQERQDAGVPWAACLELASLQIQAFARSDDEVLHDVFAMS